MSIGHLLKESRGKDFTQLDVFGGGDFQDIYNVVTNDHTNDETYLALTGTFPGLGAGHPSNPLATCRDVRYSRRGKYFWVVTASYSTRPEGTFEQQKREVPNPLDRTAYFEWESTQYNYAVVKDRDGEGVVNSAGDYPDPPPEDWDTRWQCHVTVNIPEFPADWFGLAGAVNETEFSVDGVSVGVEQARMVSMRRSRQQVENLTNFATLNYTLEFRYEGYDLEFPDQGFRYKDGAERKKIMIQDADGNDVAPSAPVALDGAGNVEEDPTPANAAFMTYEIGRVRNFTGLPGIVG